MLSKRGFSCINVIAKSITNVFTSSILSGSSRKLSLRRAPGKMQAEGMMACMQLAKMIPFSSFSSHILPKLRQLSAALKWFLTNSSVFMLKMMEMTRHNGIIRALRAVSSLNFKRQKHKLSLLSVSAKLQNQNKHENWVSVRENVEIQENFKGSFFVTHH